MFKYKQWPRSWWKHSMSANACAHAQTRDTIAVAYDNRTKECAKHLIIANIQYIMVFHCLHDKTFIWCFFCYVCYFYDNDIELSTFWIVWERQKNRTKTNEQISLWDRLMVQRSESDRINILLYIRDRC